MSGVPMCRVSGQCRGARRFRPARSWPNMQRRWASCAAGLLRQNRPPPSRFATMRRPMAVDVDSHHERVVEPRLTDTLIDGIHFALFLRPSRTDSFSDAFEMARTAIAERERKANLPSSDPQMFVGKSIKRASGEVRELPTGSDAARIRTRKPTVVGG